MSEPAVVVPAVPAKLKAIQAVLEKQKAKIAETCGKYLDPERLMRVAMATIYRTPKLQECDPWSIAGALMEAAQIGVEVGGPLDEAYLIPRKNKNSSSVQCCFQMGYKGLIKVAVDSGAASSIHAGVAHENDEFDYSFGIVPHLHHKPALKDRGAPVAAWCAGKLPSGEPFVDVMSVEDVERRRRCSMDPDSFMWKSWWDEAAVKTVIRHACKRLKGNPRLGDALEVDAGDFAVEEQRREMPRRLSDSKQVAEPQREPGDDGPPEKTDAELDAELIRRDQEREKKGA